MRFDKDLEAVKESLFCYEGFNTKDSFKVYDPRGTGVMTKDSFMHLQDEMDVDELIEAIDINKDGALNYTEWCRAITPKDARYKAPIVREHTHLTKAERNIRTFNWKTEMKNLLQIYSKAEDFNDQLKYACHVDGNEIYDEIDKPLNGFITISQIANYLRTECGYHLTEEDQKLLLNRYDRDKDFEISRDEFNYMVDFVEMDPLSDADALSYRSGNFRR